jgi:hypothetical protein
MRYMRKLAVLLTLLIVSYMPILIFSITFDWQHDGLYLRGLLDGSTRIGINAARDWLDIYGTYFFGMIRFSLFYVTLLFVSVIVFLTSLAVLIREEVKNLYRVQTRAVESA